MEKTYIERKIEAQAEEQLEKEYNDLRNYLYQNKLTIDLKIGGVGLRDGVKGPVPEKHNLNSESFKNSPVMSNISEILEKRKKEIIKERTDELLRKLDGIQYLFNQM